MKRVNVDTLVELACWEKHDKYSPIATKAILRGEYEIAMMDDDYADAMSYLEDRRQQEERIAKQVGKI